ncbi:golgin subfamily A member 6-like protein 22 [Enoplosus armatus]|uniref:golgin subfamily A member 6-like protein 22 n=1 Tax=Enoplosus armatus TaxID=215367 RepID=UPI0039957A83
MAESGDSASNLRSPTRDVTRQIKFAVDAFLEDFREQIGTGVGPPRAATEARMPQQQATVAEAPTMQGRMRERFDVVEEGASQSKAGFYQILSQEEPKAALEQRQQNSRTTQTEPNWTTENTKQLEEVDVKTKRENIKRHRQLTSRVLEEIEQLWEETQRERNEIDYLRTKTEWRQEDTDSEKHGQRLLMKRLRSQVENITERLKENKKEAAQEKMHLLEMRAEIDRERETLDRRRNEITAERHKLEVIKYDRTKWQESQEPKEVAEKKKREQEMMEGLLCQMSKYTKIVLEAKQAKDQMEKDMEDIKQALKRNKEGISHHRHQIEHAKRTMNANNNKMKQWWTKIQSDVQMQEATVPEMENRAKQEDRKDTPDTVKMKLSRIHEEMEKLWDALEAGEQQLEVTPREMREPKTEAGPVEKTKSGSQRQRQDADVGVKVTQGGAGTEGDMQGQKQAMELARVQSERDELDRLKVKIQKERGDIERDRQLAKVEMDALKRMRESTERQKRQLDETFQRTKKEMREMEVMGAEMELKKKDLAKMMRMSRRKKEEVSKMKEETGHGPVLEVDKEDRFDEQKTQRVDRNRETIQHEEDLFEEASTDNKVVLEVEEIRKMLRRVREGTEQTGGGFREEKSQVKWMNVRAKKKRRELDQLLEKTGRERGELEIERIKMQRQREEAEQKLEDARTTILTLGEVKARIEKAAAEMNNTRGEMVKAQRKMEENKDEVKKFMDFLVESRIHGSINYGKSSRS